MRGIRNGVGQFYHSPASGWGAAVCRIERRWPTKLGANYRVKVYSAICPEGDQVRLDHHHGLDGWTWIPADRAEKLIARYVKLAAKQGNHPLQSQTYATVWEALTDTPEEAAAMERAAAERAVARS